MKIASIDVTEHHVPLARPYSIAFRSAEAVEMVSVRVSTEGGRVGLGAATPESTITGETFAACTEALRADHVDWLIGSDVLSLNASTHELKRRMSATPAAMAALDIALHDSWAKALDRPLVEILGREHDALPTSITIGIKSIEQSLAEAEEYLARGFRILKVKIGESLEQDVERLARLRERVGPSIAIRADANVGYSPAEVVRFLDETRSLSIEFLEQPVRRGVEGSLCELPESARRGLAADESLLDERDALRLAESPAPFGIWNIKLMKCGGIASALRIGAIAEAADIDLMWGCMDESCVGIAAALHAALASPKTRYLDLDGSLDLSRDFARGGFALENGRMRTLDRPGLGVELE